MQGLKCFFIALVLVVLPAALATPLPHGAVNVVVRDAAPRWISTAAPFAREEEIPGRPSGIMRDDWRSEDPLVGMTKVLPRYVVIKMNVEKYDRRKGVHTVRKCGGIKP
ncbi:hypothetical protein C8R43DRAFT_963230 [Mycena crocata]|nr:hypothetical protein C8R43DRAFT_963230 [Mycena crocata]